MPRKQKPAEVREQAVALAAGGSASAAARELGLNERTVRHWVQSADAPTIAEYVRQKRAIATQTVLERVEHRVRRITDAIEDTPIQDARDVQALATAHAIMDTRHGGHEHTTGTTTRFGSEDPFDTLSPSQRVIAERITERLYPQG